MAKLPSWGTRAIVGAVVVALIAGVLYFVLQSDDTRKVSANFTEAIGVYPGTPVKVLGVNVGEVTKVTPQGDSVQRVAMASMPAATTAQANVSDGNIIRDASLDQYLEAHQQFGLQPVVSGSMPLLRAASLTTQGH